MIISNEPGYYKANEYGIRIESLLAVKELFKAENGKYCLGFETITLAPVDLRIVDRNLLIKQDIEWLNKYHKKVYETHLPHLNKKESAWLKDFLTF